MLKPKRLEQGDLIRVVSPASPLLPEKVEFARSLLESWGYRVEFGKHAFDWTAHLAGSDEDRANDLMEAFSNPDVSAVFCARGGYGCARLFPFLDLDAIANSAKMFLGFSDITTLHLALNKRGLPTLHAPMPLTLSVPREDWVFESLKRNLAGDTSVPESALKGTASVTGTAQGNVMGGCLILMCDSLGTPNSLSCEGKIVVIEDVDENPHRIDAMLTHLLNEGSIQRAAGIVVGEMTRTDEKSDQGIGGRPWREIVSERLAPLGIPMIVEYPFGHASNMLTLPLGIRAELNADMGTLTYLESLCEN
jgi:muramoyltetrapeptide carboxypeptidase